MQSQMNESAKPLREISTTGFRPEEYSFLVPIRASGTRPPLFCAFLGPPGGREFVDMLPEDQPIYDLYLSDRRATCCQFYRRCSQSQRAWPLPAVRILERRPDCI